MNKKIHHDLESPEEVTFEPDHSQQATKVHDTNLTRLLIHKCSETISTYLHLVSKRSCGRSKKWTLWKRSRRKCGWGDQHQKVCNQGFSALSRRHTERNVSNYNYGRWGECFHPEWRWFCFFFSEMFQEPKHTPYICQEKLKQPRSLT